MEDDDDVDATGVVTVIPHEKAPVDAPLTKTVLRRGIDDGDAARVGATCYGPCTR
jgi:hypothetical protein